MRIWGVIFVMAAVGSAHGQAGGSRQPQFPWFGSGEGRRMYDVGNRLKLDCPADDTANKRTQIQQVISELNAAQDPKVKAAATRFAQELQTWFEGWVTGIPGAGTWAEIDAQWKKSVALEDALPVKHPQVPLERDVAGALDRYAAVAAEAPRTRTFQQAIDGSPCRLRAGGDWNALAYRMEQAAGSLRNVVGTLVNRLQTSVDQWAGGRPNLEPTPPATYWEHADWVMKQIDYLATASKMAQVKADLEKFAPFEPRAAALVKDLEAKLAGARSEDAKLAAELKRVEMPPMPKDAGRAKMVKAAVAGINRVMIGTPVGAKGSSTEKWTEKVEVRRTSDKIWYRLVKFEREVFTTHYAWQPSGDKITAPDLPGLPRTEICEIWVQNFTRYKKGDPSRKAWFPSQDWREAYIPCANIDKTSSMKMK